MLKDYNGKVLSAVPWFELVQRVTDAFIRFYGPLWEDNSIKHFATELCTYGGEIDPTWTTYGYHYVKAIRDPGLAFVVPQQALKMANEWQGELVQLKDGYQNTYKKWLLKFWFGSADMENEAKECLSNLPDKMVIQRCEPYMAKEECFMAYTDKYPYPIPVSFLTQTSPW